MHGLEHSPWGFRGTRHGTSDTRQQHLSTLTPRPLPATAVRPSPLAHGLPADEARPLPLPAVGALDVPLQVAGVVELAAADVTRERACGGDRSGHLASRAELNGARAVAERRGPRAPARPRHGPKSGAESRAETRRRGVRRCHRAGGRNRGPRGTPSRGPGLRTVGGNSPAHSVTRSLRHEALCVAEEPRAEDGLGTAGFARTGGGWTGGAVETHADLYRCVYDDACRHSNSLPS